MFKLIPKYYCDCLSLEWLPHSQYKVFVCYSLKIHTRFKVGIVIIRSWYSWNIWHSLLLNNNHSLLIYIYWEVGVQLIRFNLAIFLCQSQSLFSFVKLITVFGFDAIAYIGHHSCFNFLAHLNQSVMLFIAITWQHCHPCRSHCP